MDLVVVTIETGNPPALGVSGLDRLDVVVVAFDVPPDKVVQPDGRIVLDGRQRLVDGFGTTVVLADGWFRERHLVYSCTS